MGLLYVSGQPFHDEDQELIERLYRAERRGLQMGRQLVRDESEVYADVFDLKSGRDSLSSQVRAAARKRAEQSEQ